MFVHDVPSLLAAQLIFFEDKGKVTYYCCHCGKSTSLTSLLFIGVDWRHVADINFFFHVKVFNHVYASTYTGYFNS